jgi:oxalate decarboxylase
MTPQQNSNYFFTSQLLKEIESCASGALHALTSSELSGLDGLSLVDMTLKTNGVLNPHWHPNAQKIGYCTQGKMLVSIHGPTGSEQFLVEKGEIFYLPQGSIHHIENISDVDGIIKFALNHSEPETMTLSRSFSATPDTAISSTFGADSDFATGLRDAATHDLLGTLSQQTSGGKVTAHRYKFNIEKSNDAVLTPGGYLKVGLKVNLAALEGVGILGFGLNPNGAVEPHWHPNSNELVYVTKGRIRGMLLSPDGQHEVHERGEGEGFFAPMGYFHSIENIGEGEMEAIAFFDNPEMVYVGLGEAIGTISDEVLASAFHVDPSYFKRLRKPGGPLIIVPS